MALSKTSLFPRYPLICAGSPERAWARASVQPQIFGVLGHRRRAEQLDERRDLHVLELADVEMPAELALRPAEEDVARRLHERGTR